MSTAAAHQHGRLFDTSQTPSRLNLIYQGPLNIYLTKKTIISKHFTGHQGCTYPTASLRNVLAKDQPNLTSPSDFATRNIAGRDV